MRCPTCAGQVVVPQTDVAAADGAVKPSNGAEQPLFERSDFDELFKTSEPDDPAVIGPRPVATAPPVEAPAGAWGTHAEPAYDVERLNPAALAPGLGDLIKTMVSRYQAKTNAVDVPPHVSMGFNQTWILLNNVLPVAKAKYGGFDPEAIRKAALDVDIPPGGTIQGYGVKFYPPGTPLAGQNERSTPVVMQYAGEHIAVVWPNNIKTQEPVLPLPASSIYALR